MVFRFIYFHSFHMTFLLNCFDKLLRGYYKNEVEQMQKFKYKTVTPVGKGCIFCNSDTCCQRYCSMQKAGFRLHRYGLMPAAEFPTSLACFTLTNECFHGNVFSFIEKTLSL